MFKVLVCGGRDFSNQHFLNSVLEFYHGIHSFTTLIEGGAKGADSLAKTWAITQGILVETYPADWGKYGKAAGHERNSRMLRLGQPQLVIAFPGGTGTANMTKQALAAGVKVVRCSPQLVK